MKVLIINRNANLGFSIQKVFKPVIATLRSRVDLDEIHINRRKSSPIDLILNNWQVFRERQKFEIFHITGHVHEVILALFKSKVVLTVHDLVFIDNEKNPFVRFYKWLFWLYFPVKIASKVVCISNQTLANIRKHVSASNLVVIHNAVDEKYLFVPKQFNLDCPVVLHVGSGWNKNLENTILAIRGLRCHLRVLGRLRESQIKLLEEFKIDYSSVTNLTDEEVYQEYINCDIVSFPSIYEGFGMPIIEGQAVGRPVLTSKIEPLIEVAGEGAQFVDPHSTQSIRLGFIQLLGSSSLRNELVEKGLLNVERFRLNRVVDQYLSIYSSI